MAEGELYSDRGDERVKTQPYADKREQLHGRLQPAHSRERLRPCQACCVVGGQKAG